MPQSAIKKLKKYNSVSPSNGGIKDPVERERLIAKHAPLVKTIAGRLKMKLPSHVSQDDLLGSGIIGLLDAIDKFNSDLGVGFRSYAEFRIRGAMIDELRTMDWVPRSVRKNGKVLQDAYLKIEREKNRPAKDEEVAKELGIDMESFYRLLDEVKGITIINEEEIGDVIPQENLSMVWPLNRAASSMDALGTLNNSEIRSVISEAIEGLPKNERLVMTLYYYEELTMKEIGKVMGYTESRVSQLHTKGALRLKGSLQDYIEG